MIKIFKRKTSLNRVQIAKSKVDNAFKLFTDAHQTVVEAIDDLNEAVNEHENNIQFHQESLENEKNAVNNIKQDIDLHEKLVSKLKEFLPY